MSQVVVVVVIKGKETVNETGIVVVVVVIIKISFVIETSFIIVVLFVTLVLALIIFRLLQCECSKQAQPLQTFLLSALYRCVQE